MTLEPNTTTRITNPDDLLVLMIECKELDKLIRASIEHWLDLTNDYQLALVEASINFIKDFMDVNNRIELANDIFIIVDLDLESGEFAMAVNPNLAEKVYSLRSRLKDRPATIGDIRNFWIKCYSQ